MISIKKIGLMSGLLFANIVGAAPAPTPAPPSPSSATTKNSPAAPATPAAPAASGAPAAVNTSPPPEYRANAGVTDTNITLGQSAPLTGAASSLGTEFRTGAIAFFTTLNKNGGVNGRSISLTTLDDGYEPDRTAANTKKLIAGNDVFALFGYVGTPTSNAAAPIFKEARVPFFGAFTGAESLRNPMNHYIFNVRASYFDETEKIVEQLVSLGLTKIAVFCQNDAYGKAGLSGVEKAMKARGLAIQGVATVERNSVDVTAASQALVKLSPDAIIMISAYTSVSAFAKEVQNAKFRGQLQNVSFVGSTALAAELGDYGYGVGISQVVPFPYSGSSSIVSEYQANMKIVGVKTFSFTSMEGYLAAKIITEGIRRAGKNLTREGLITALEGMKNVDFGGFNINYSATDHSGSKFVDLTMIGKDGKFIK